MTSDATRVKAIAELSAAGHSRNWPRDADARKELMAMFAAQDATIARLEAEVAVGWVLAAAVGTFGRCYQGPLTREILELLEALDAYRRARTVLKLNAPGAEDAAEQGADGFWRAKVAQADRDAFGHGAGEEGLSEEREREIRRRFESLNGTVREEGPLRGDLTEVWQTARDLLAEIDRLRAEVERKDKAWQDAERRVATLVGQRDHWMAAKDQAEARAEAAERRRELERAVLEAARAWYPRSTIINETDDRLGRAVCSLNLADAGEAGGE